MNTSKDITDFLANSLRNRVATCRMYAEPACSTIALHNTAVVSTTTNQRGIYSIASGQQALGMYAKLMPTLWSPADAKTLVAAFNAQLEAEGSDERVVAMSERQWWKAELESAEKLLAELEGAEA